MSWPDLKHKLAGVYPNKLFILSERHSCPQQKDAAGNLK